MWRNFQSGAGNLGQYNKRLHILNIVTPEGRKHARERTNAISNISPHGTTGDSSDDPVQAADSSTAFSQSHRAIKQSIPLEKYIQDKTKELESIAGSLNKLPLDWRWAFYDSTRMNSDLLNKIIQIDEKKMKEALVDDIDGVSYKLKDHNEVIAFFNENSPIILKAAEDASRITDKALSDSVYAGLMSGTKALKKLLDMHPFPAAKSDPPNEPTNK